MKKFRPYKAGFIVLYFFMLISVVDVIYTMISMQTDAESIAGTFSMWSLLIFLLAGVYTHKYMQTMVGVSKTSLQIKRIALLPVKQGQKRAMFLFRQGDKDNKLIDLTVPLEQLDRYGYVETFGLKPQDKSGASPKNKLFPLHEVSFILQDGKDYRMNVAIYSKKQQKEIFRLVKEYTGVEPTGDLAKDLAAM